MGGDPDHRMKTILAILLLLVILVPAGSVAADDSRQVIPTPFPTPVPLVTETLETDVFWEITTYEQPVSAVQTLFQLTNVQTIITIFTWLAGMSLGLALVRGIVAMARSQGAEDV